ncbi:MAG: tautomerase family protein [Firmicutes bacterium]|nr:tautomerase family protein [Bacillota bacterium]
MPLVKVEILKGKTQEYKKAILDGIHSALVEAFKIPDHDRMQRLYELEKDCFEISPNNTDKITLIEITVFKGRSLEAKRNLYSAIVRNLAQSPGIEGKDIFIVINEQPLENWGVKGGLPASEVDFGFKIEV